MTANDFFISSNFFALMSLLLVIAGYLALIAHRLGQRDKKRE